MFKKLREVFRGAEEADRDPAQNRTDSLVPLSRDELIIEVRGLKQDLLLNDWLWLLPADSRPVVASKMGDLFVEAGEGSIFHLDTCTGDFQMVAESRESFDVEMDSTHFRRDVLLSDLVALKKLDGDIPTGHQCFSWVHPPVLGGSYEASNLEVSDLYVHLSITGQIHRQCKDLPPGTQVTGITFDET